MISSAFVAKLLLVASHISGYPIPDHYLIPTIKEINTQEMQRVCRAFAFDAGVVQPDCDGMAGFYHDGNTIWIDLELLKSKAILTENDLIIHELTHWLQKQNGKGGFECPNVIVRELEAYHAENVYIQKVEHRQIIAIPQLPCGARMLPQQMIIDQ